MTQRATYHHGDLRNALITAGAQLAAESGPGAVGIRPAARIVGVTPTAAYRHFADGQELRTAVCDRAFEVLTEAMRDNVAEVGAADTPQEQALLRLAAIGRAYINVALAEPGLFRIAFGHLSAPPATSEEAGPTAFGMLTQALDDLVDVGVLSPERRTMAEIAAWSAVHGFSRLVLDGPLSALSEDDLQAASERVLSMVTDSFA